MIHFLNVTKLFPGGRVGLENVAFHIRRGEFTLLTGPSGAGKSTLLRLIYREAIPTSGRILVNGRNVSSIPRKKIPFLRRTVGVVFQDFRLIPRKTVVENVTFLPRILGMSAREQRRLAHETLVRVGLGQRLDAFPEQLSGGEQQRVAIARALIAEPELLLADEPTGNLDPKLSLDILRLFEEIHHRGTTVLVATHEPQIISRVGDRILSLDEGRLVRDEPIQPGAGLEALDPASPAPTDPTGAPL